MLSSRPIGKGNIDVFYNDRGGKLPEELQRLVDSSIEKDPDGWQERAFQPHEIDLTGARQRYEACAHDRIMCRRLIESQS